MPNTPHSSWNLSSRHVTFKAPPPRVLEPAEIGVDNRGRTTPDPEPLAAGRSDPSPRDRRLGHQRLELQRAHRIDRHDDPRRPFAEQRQIRPPDRKSTRLNSSHITISYAVFCLKKKKTQKLNLISAYQSIYDNIQL